MTLRKAGADEVRSLLWRKGVGGFLGLTAPLGMTGF